jgi:hypothetical protein
VLVAVTVVTTVCQLADLAWAGRPLVTLAFFVFVPGGALASRHRIEDPLAEVTIGVALSLGIGTAVASLMLALDQWRPEVAQVGLAIASLPLLVAQIREPDEGEP